MRRFVSVPRCFPCLGGVLISVVPVSQAGMTDAQAYPPDGWVSEAGVVFSVN